MFDEAIISMPATPLLTNNLNKWATSRFFDIVCYVLYNEESASIPKEDIYEYSIGHI